VLVAEGNLPDARKAYEACVTIDERLTAIDPSNAEWRDDLVISRKRLAELASE